MINPVLDAIKDRRSVPRFESTQMEDDKLEAILEAGRWAPSWLNKQPWDFVVVKDKNIREQLSEVVPTAFVQGLREAPLCIAIVVDPREDPYHFVEDGAVVAQNMALATHSLGLHSSWIGVFDLKGQKNSAESKAKQVLGVPKEHRLIALLPIGHVKSGVPKKERKTLRQIVHQDRFGNR